ncbi:MAG: phosphate-starvation-inducible PsiE family protein [Thiohalocapsa sp.]
MREIVVTFGVFLAVLIAIETFMKTTLYLRDDVVHVRLVIATALMAIARKVIIFDFEKLQPMYVPATAAVVLALGLVYWLMDRKTVLGAHFQRPDNAAGNGNYPQGLAPIE